MKKIITAFVTLGLLLLSGCATPESPPTATPVPTETPVPPTATPAPTETPVPPLATSADDVIGLWSFGSGPSTQFFQFDEDGTYVMARGVVTNIEDSPLHFGPFLFEGGLLTFVTSDDSAGCPGRNGTYEVRLLEQGRLALILVEDECNLRAGENYSALVPLSP